VEVHWTVSRPASAITVEDHDAVLRGIEQHGTAWRLRALIRLALAPYEERELRWTLQRGNPPVLPDPPAGVRMAVLEDGTDTWGHSLVSYGREVTASPATTLRCAGGPDGLVEVFGHWHEHDRALKLILPWSQLSRSPSVRFTTAQGEMPGGEWDGPVWGRIWSYDCVDDSLRVTIRRSPPYALHDPIPRIEGIDYSYTDQGPFLYRLWLEPHPRRVPPEVVSL
jgi:hypothetical protein